ncbi:DMT family transporter [Streptomyces sp. NPDC048278]|uniref:DMT family transporter n=1 Tax=Streptomyces sp. NPDC048278 TaxID=3155809 RepID=UPI003432E1E5
MKSRLDPLSMAAMAVTVVAVSATAPLTAAASASPLAMAFWRNCLGFAVLGPFLLVLRRREVVRVTRGERGLLRREQWWPLVFGFLAATTLALHFAAFMTSTRLTSVAMSTALVATQPLWQALIAAAQGAWLPRRAWMGLALSVAGAAAAGGLDIRSGGTALLGDLLALVGAVAQAGYTALSERSRADVSTPLYSTFTSLVCGMELLVVCLLAHIPLTGFDRSTQLSLLGLLVLPQILGLGSLNFALGRTSATVMSVLLLLETPVAALAAWWFMGQGIKPATLPGLVLIIVGVTVVVTNGVQQTTEQRGRHRRTRVSAPATVPYTPQAMPAPRRSAFPDFTERDPRVEWAAHTVDTSPTVTLTYHGSGAFDTLLLRRPQVGEGEPGLDGPAGPPVHLLPVRQVRCPALVPEQVRHADGGSSVHRSTEY